MLFTLNTFIALLVLAVSNGSRLDEPPRQTTTVESINALEVLAEESTDNVFNAGSPTGDFEADHGFLFVRGKYFDTSTVLSWQAEQLRIENTTSSMLAFAASASSQGVLDIGPAWDLTNSATTDTLHITEVEMHGIRSTLSNGGIVALANDRRPLLVDLSKGGYELIESLTYPSGSKREELLDSAFSVAGYQPEPDVRSWFSDLQPNINLSKRAVALTHKAHAIESANIAAASAVHRFDSWSYPITVIAMIVFVFSIGSLLTVRPQELVAVAQTEAETSVSKFLWLIGGMSAIDLAWTLLAHQANHITEVNPMGGLILEEPTRIIFFKVLATGLAIGILYRTRNNLFARKACWWICLTLALLMARWILVSDVVT